jgi:hypothetical protein
VKAEISDHDNRGLGQAQCRCEAPGENLYNRRLDQETAVFDDDDDDNATTQRQLFNPKPYVINGQYCLECGLSPNGEVTEEYWQKRGI